MPQRNSQTDPTILPSRLLSGKNGTVAISKSKQTNKDGGKWNSKHFRGYFPQCCHTKEDKLRPAGGDAATRPALGAPAWKLSVSHTYFFPAAILIYRWPWVLWAFDVSPHLKNAADRAVVRVFFTLTRILHGAVENKILIRSWTE